MENLSSVISSVFHVTRLLYFRLTCFVYEFHFGLGGGRGGMPFLLYVVGILIFSAHNFLFKLFDWYPQMPWLDDTHLIVLLLIMQYTMIIVAENQWRWIIREWRLLRAVCDDVSAFKAEALKADMSHHLLDSDLLRLQPIEEEWVNSAKQILGNVESFGLTLSGRRDSLRKQILFFRVLYLYLMKTDISKHLERLDKSGINIYGSLDRSMSMLRRLQNVAVEDDSGSVPVRQLAAVLSSVRNKVKDFIHCQQDYPNLTRHMLLPIQQVEWKIMSLEAFLKDLEHVKLEHAIQKAWIEEAQILMGDLDLAIDTYTQRMGNGVCWFFSAHCLLAWPWLSREIDWVADGLDSFCKQKHRYGFKFIRRQQQAQPYHKDIAVINKVQSLLNKICHEVNQEPITSSKVLREITYLSNLLEKMHKLLENVKAIEGASNFRLFCIDQMKHITKRAENVIETCRSSSAWKALSKETTLIEPFIDDLERSIKACDIERRQNSITGLEEDTDALVSQMTTGTEQCNIFSIVGMQGIGKTTLANKVYHHKAIWSHFPRRAWVFLPQGSNDVNTLLEVVGKQIMGITDLREEGSGKEYWVQKIQNFLQQERYFVVLDNISTRKEWDMLKDAFPRRNNSRLLLTTRCKTVALHADQNNPLYLLRLRTKEETWVSFKEKAQLRPDRLPQEMVRKVKDVVERCGGLPLTISSLGFLMSGKTPNDQELSRAIAQINQHRKLWLQNFSNNDLPQHLKALLAYFTLFPRNFEIAVRRLIALWVAEGVLQQSANGEITLENMAEKYLSELIGLNTIQPVENYVNGKVKSCCLPDSSWDVVLSMSISSSRRRLADHGDNNHASFKLIHGGGTSPHAEWQRYKNLLSLISFDTRDGDKPGEDIGNFLSRGIANRCFRELRVLDLEHVFRPQLPSTIGNMVELRYLGLRWTYLEEIPSTIGNLMNLQTLDLKHTYIRTLPPTFWKLQKLRHLYLNHTHRSKFARQSKTRPMQNLQTLWGVFLDKNSPLKDTINELKSLRKLKLAFQLSEGDQQELAKRVVKLQHLQYLRLSSIDVMGEPQELYLEDYSGLKTLSDMYLFGRLESVSVLLKLPQSLSDLTLSASRLQYDPMPILEMLPNLKSLSLLSDSYLGERMVCSSKMFPKLLVLKLLKLSGLTEWIIETDTMENLKELEIRSCQQLKVPTGLKHLKILRELKLRHMEEEFTATLTENRGPIWDNTIPDIICE